MKKLLYLVLAVCTVSTSIFTVSCKDGETYAERKKKEEKSIGQFIQDNDFVGKINPITEEQFYAQDSMTDLSKNEFVRFNSDGIYMQIVRKGEGPTMAELAKGRADTTVTRPILCKFLEYDIQGGDTTCTNMTIHKDMTSQIDEMMCTYSHYSRSYTASYTKGEMKNTYGSGVPTGWLKPLDFIRLTKVDGEEAKVRIIVPHSSGTSNASGHVQPFYYEITYMIPPNY
ncbi:MAG: DUF4827 domain-containing protein [Bacteroidaceae bacterium]|nr:DUF4827 domain-containing protein [Bacteroidaceae bacterium]